MEARIIEIKKSGRFERIIVNRKQLQYEAQKASEKEEFAAFEADAVFEGTVKRLTDFGAFVSIRYAYPML